MVQDRVQHNRFKDAPWYPKEPTYTLIGGAGGIGSWLAVLLARAGFKIVIHDFDLLEEHNLGGQLYGRKHIGKHKVAALEEVISDFCVEDIITSTSAIDTDSPTNSIVFSAFDNMKARKLMFESWRKEFNDTPGAIFIDGRLTAEQMWIYCVVAGNKKSLDAYSKLMEVDTDATIEDAPCTLKQTSHAAAMIASHMVGFFTNHMTNVREGDQMREVPYLWEYFIPMNLVESENS